MNSIQFIGATGTVTGSKFYLKLQNTKILVDCGLFQGLKTLRLRNWKQLEVSPAKLDAVILTHAHIDHSGYVPLLVKKGYKGKIYATEGTKALCDILLPDSGHLQEDDADFANRHKISKHSPALPLYTEMDARDSLHSFKTVAWDKKVKLEPEVSFKFRKAGHILGSAIVKIQYAGKTITFTGDLGRQKQIIMNVPETIKNTDYLVLESTYGNRVHENIDPLIDLENIFKATIERGGRVLIPSFAVGRTQQLLYLINRLIKKNSDFKVPVYVDSPMANAATKIFCKFTDETAIPPEECKDIMNQARMVATKEDSIALMSRTEPAIIISASGMATGGRVLHHLKTMLPDKKNTVLFAGFQAAGTRGEALLNGKKTIRIHGEDVPVAAEISNLDTLSAHADCEEIIQWLKGFRKPPKTTFIVHGEPLASDELRKRIERELGWNVVIPEYREKYLI